MRARQRLSCSLVTLAALWLTATALADPAQPVRMCAEWEPAFGTLIRWPLGIPSALVVELAADDSLYVLVETSGQENYARSTFESWGVNLDHVRFIRANTYSHWTRDWGPHSVFDGSGTYGIADPYFDGYPWVSGCHIDGDVPAQAVAQPVAQTAARMTPSRAGTRGWEEDDAVNGVLAAELGCLLHEMPAYCTGGNIMVDGHGIAFSTRRMADENAPLWSEEEFRGLAQDYLGIHSYRFLDDPEIHGIQHIDCYAKLLDEETVLVKEVPAWHPEYACVERLVDQISAQANCYGRPYTIVRVFCDSYSGNAVAGYTNSLILNTKVLVPLFGIASDDDALQTFADAMPGYEVIGFPYGSWYYYDALHCRTMGIFDRHMLRIWHRRLDAEVPWAPVIPIEALIDDRSEAGLLSAELSVYWRVQGEASWNRVALAATAGADSFRAEIPSPAAGTNLEYYLAAADLSGRAETLPRSAPAGFYSFTLVADPASAEDAQTTRATTRITVAPNPLRDGTTIRFSAPGNKPLALEIYDARGRCVRRLSADSRATHWDGRDAGGHACAAGLYWIVLRDPAETTGRRCLIVR